MVGAGHNALVCACYLAKAGHDVTVYERRSRVGGAVNTEEMWGGYQVDTCSVMHVLIHKTPIIEELGCAISGWNICRWTRGASRPSRRLPPPLL